MPLLFLVGIVAIVAMSGGGKARGSSSPSSSARPSIAVGGTLAERLAANIKAKGYDYDRSLCKQFQTSAGLKADGIYGPGTAAALSKLTVAPKALFKGASTAATPVG